MKRRVGAGLVTCLLLAATACGGSGGSGDKASSSAPDKASSSASSSRPSVDDLSKSLRKGAAGSSGSYTKAQADCLAGVLVKSDVSDKALQAIAKLDTKFKETKKDDTALNAVVGDLQKCGPTASPSGSPSPAG
jgi:hypothetical protein